MADITSAIDKMNTDEVAQDKPLTEALFTKIGANINGLIDDVIEEDLVDRVEVLESRIENAIDVNIFISSWFLPEDIGFTNELHPGYTKLCISTVDEYFIAQFTPTYAETAPGVFLSREPYRSTFDQSFDITVGGDPVADTNVNQVTIDFTFRSGRWQVRYKVVTYVEI